MQMIIADYQVEMQLSAKKNYLLTISCCFICGIWNECLKNAYKMIE